MPPVFHFPLSLVEALWVPDVPCNDSFITNLSFNSPEATPSFLTALVAPALSLGASRLQFQNVADGSETCHVSKRVSASQTEFVTFIKSRYRLSDCGALEMLTPIRRCFRKD